MTAAAMGGLARQVELIFESPLPTRAEIHRICTLARQNGYRSVAIPSGALALVQHLLAEDDIRISCRIGFPNGSSDPDVKRYETEVAIDSGAHEIELLPSVARLLDNEYSFVLREIRDVAEAADERPVKVAFPPGFLESANLNQLVPMVLDSGAHFLCAEVQLVHPLRQLGGPAFGILARLASLSEAQPAIDAGAHLVSLPAR